MSNLLTFVGGIKGGAPPQGIALIKDFMQGVCRGVAPINRENVSGGAEPRLTSGGEAVAWVS